MEPGAGRHRCPHCHERLEARASFCWRCGEPVAVDSVADTRAPGAAPRSRSRAFAPGTVIAERYRIVAPLGQGGMGSVYRADDLKLGVQVALKFLHGGVGDDPRVFEALRAEVRLARRVAHHNVCSVYDIGEVDGRQFLTMEYVGGEDLGSLLRRIGRLPADKAAELAQQICAGLGAAHRAGVIHRDLKPANIMVDGQGQAKITDFGLAIVDAERESHREVAGTLRYMAPEQLRGEPASQASDLWALGAVIHELFTGRPAFESDSMTSLRRDQELRPPSPSSSVSSLDPAIDRAVAACFELDPRHRPRSVSEVATMLPGADPLEAVLAAGRTPSPRLLVEAGDRGPMTPVAAWALFSLIGALVVVAVLMGRQLSLIGTVDGAKAPVVLADRARELVADLGLEGESVHRLWWLEGATRAIRDGEPPGPGRLRLVYRSSPRALAQVNPLRAIDLDHPPMDRPGMLGVVLDGTGRLLELRAVPPESALSSTQGAGTDWGVVLEAAGAAEATVGEPSGRPPAPVAFNRLRGWRLGEERYLGAELAGWPVFFAPGEPAVEGRSGRGGFRWLVGLLWFVAVYGLLAVALLMARHNLRLKRADLKGAARLALAFGLGSFAATLLAAPHQYGSPADLFWWTRTNGSSALWRAAVAWCLWVALEPFARRRWPELLFGCNRVFAGRFRDTLVGRHLLIGALAGAGMANLLLLIRVAGARIAGEPVRCFATDLTTALGGRFVLAGVLAVGVWALIGSLFAVFGLSIGCAISNRRFLGVPIAGVMTFAAYLGGGERWANPRQLLVEAAVFAIGFVAIVAHSGMVAGFAAAVVVTVLMDQPVVLGLEQWSSWPAVIMLSVVGLLSLFGVVAAIGRRPAPAVEHPS